MFLLLKNEKRFCIVALIWGVLFTFLIPLWQVPDEYAHVEMIGQAIKNEELASVLLEEVPLEEHRIRWNLEERIDVTTLCEAMVKKAEYQRAALFPRGISIRILSHLPAALGIFVGILFKLPAYWVLIVGRLFSLVFYIIVCGVSLELMPLEKDLFELIMLLPMCIQEAASLSYDAVLLPLSFLIVSYILYLKFKAIKIGIWDVLIIAGMLFWIALIKPPYVVLAGICLSVSSQKIHIKIGKYIITGDIVEKLKWVIPVVLAVIIYLGRSNTWIRLVVATLRHLYRTMWLFGRTCKVWGAHIFESMMGKFGYFDARTATWFMAAVAAFGLVIAMTTIKGTTVSEVHLTVKDKVIIYIVLGVCFYLVTVSMISFTAGDNTQDWNKALYEITEIHGLQGRYYIPMLILFLLPMPKILEMKEQVYRKLVVGAYVFACIYTCGVICVRYWTI